MPLDKRNLKKKSTRMGIIISLLILSTLFFYLKLGSSNFIKSIISPLSGKVFKQKIDETRLKESYKMITDLDFPNSNDTYSQLALSIPVLNYHGIETKTSGINFSQEDFKNQMVALKKDGWETITIEQFVNFIKGRETNIRKKTFLLTFDDGRKDTFYGADPILKALNYTAVMYVITGNSLIDNPSNFYLNKPELRFMKDSSRWELQPHTNNGHIQIPVNDKGGMGNFYSNKLWISDSNRLETDKEFEERIKDDMQQAKDKIESFSGNKALSFAFPFGDFGEKSENYPKASDIVSSISNNLFQVAFYQDTFSSLNSQNYPTLKTSLFKRYSMKDTTVSANTIVSLMNSVLDKNINYTESFDNGDNWFNTGSLVAKDKHFILTANKNQQSVDMVLNGSRMWSNNYLYTLDTKLSSGMALSLFGGYKDSTNYSFCNFTEKQVSLVRVTKGIRSTLSKIDTGDIPQKTSTYGFLVNGNNISCLINNTEYIHLDNLTNDRIFGGVGLSLWSEKKDSASILLSSIKTVSLDSNKLKNFTKLIVETTKLNPIVDIKSAQLVSVTKDNMAWILVWGNLGLNKNLLDIYSGQENTSAFSILNTDLDYSNNKFITKFDLIRGETVSLVSRYKDSNNYVACSFYNNFFRSNVSLEKVVDGILTKEAEAPLFFRVKNIKDIPFEISAIEDTVSCGANGTIALTKKLSDISKSGKFGIKIWDKIKNNAQVLVRDIYINSI